MKNILVIFLLLFFLLSFRVLGQDIRTETNKLVEIDLISQNDYNCPLRDVDTKCKLTYQDGNSFSISGFWNGKKSYKVRFSLPYPGNWQYLITSNDSTNTGLHNISGNILVTGYSGSNEFLEKGYIKVSPDGHYFTYGNGDPFFYLGESAWEISWKSTRSQFLKYISNRKQKGFNVIQIAAMSHDLLWNYGVMNREGKKTFLDSNFSIINPEYFEYLDFVIKTANDSGLAVALLPVIAPMTRQHFDMGYYNIAIPDNECRYFYKYIASRYAGSNIIWLTTANGKYNTEMKKNFWLEISDIIKTSTGKRQMTTILTTGWNSSFDYFDNSAGWPDFNTFQSSPMIDCYYNYMEAEKGYNLVPPKPVLAFEVCYEDFPNRMESNGIRLSEIDCRESAYQSLLSGSLPGAVYAANGIYQWASPEIPDPTNNPRVYYENAWELPGSSSMSVLKKIMKKYDWYKLVPAANLLIDHQPEKNKVCIAASSDKIIAYLPEKTEYVNIVSTNISYLINYVLINAATGDSSVVDSVVCFNSYKYSMPDSGDHILIIRKSNKTYIPDSNTIFAETNRLVEISLISNKDYTDPINDIDLICKVTHINGTSQTVCGFWDGNRLFRVRFSCPINGEWNYLITCSDTLNSGLHNKNGKVIIKKYEGNNPFYLKGFPKVAAESRYLTYGNGEPYFYFGDTIWEVYWKSTKGDVERYLSDRKKKGFNNIQTISMSHNMLWYYGVKNREGQTTFLNNDWSQINPRYFDYMDYVIKTANDSGFLVSLMPLAGGMFIMHSYNHYFDRYFTVEQTLQLAKYIGTRYSGLNIVWITAGDMVYKTPEIRDFWTSVGNLIKKVTGSRQIMTVHCAGWSLPSDFFDYTTNWLDFDMFQASHVRNAYYNYIGPLKSLQVQHPRPLLGAELCYEDFHDSVWTDYPRIDDYDVRQANYESILSGAIAGATYGCNGVFQWEDPRITTVPKTYDSRYYLDDAWKLPGSSNMGILKKLFEKYNWYDLIPNQDLLINYVSERNHICVAEGKDKIITYAPKRTTSITLKTEKFKNIYSRLKITWIKANSGDSIFQYINNPTNLVLEIPDSNDYLIIITGDNSDSVKDSFKPEKFTLSQNFPNPFNPSTVINFELPVSCWVTIKIYNSLGQEVHTLVKGNLRAGKYMEIWKPSNLSSGVYYYRIQAGTYSEIKKMLLIK
jgi:hypothetical protein